MSDEQAEFEDLVTAFTAFPERFAAEKTAWCRRCGRGKLIRFYWDSVDGRTVYRYSARRDGGPRTERIGYCPAAPGDWSGAILAHCPRCGQSMLLELEMIPRRAVR